MIRRTSLVTGFVLGAFFSLGSSAPAVAHEMPIELWALMLLPSCQKHVERFSERAAVPYVQWSRIHREELAEFAGIDARVTDSANAAAATTGAPSNDLRTTCEGLLSYLVDDVQPPDPRFASPQATWNVFLQSARVGDKATMAECFAPLDRAQHMPMIDAMTAAQLATLAGAFTGFQPIGTLNEGMQEVLINRGELAGIALFVKTRRGWRLSNPP